VTKNMIKICQSKA